MTKYLLTLAVIVLSINFSTAQNEQAINTDNSSIAWTGKKVVGNSHTGTINITGGSLEFDAGRLSGGSFTIDMTSITNTDDMGDAMKGKLEGHLKSDDFFGVETYPTAQLVITNVGPDDGGYAVTADLTIKGKTAPVTFIAKVESSMATAEISVDRTIYDVKYGSGKFFDSLGDNMISDIFDLVVNLAF